MPTHLSCLGAQFVLAVAIAVTPLGAQTQVQPIQSGFGKGAYALGTMYLEIKEAVEPKYPAAALQARIEGVVLLEIVVNDKGGVGDVRVVKSLDVASGLDASAIAAVKKWKFVPASIAGRTVSALVPVRVAFHLHPANDPNGKPFTEAGVTADNGDAEPVRAGTSGVTWPTATKSVKPKYTPAAMKQKLEGVVDIELVVGVDGRVTSARVTKSLDVLFGLDEAALAAAREWRFNPGRRNGVPVPVIVSLSLEFRLR